MLRARLLITYTHIYTFQDGTNRTYCAATALPYLFFFSCARFRLAQGPLLVPNVYASISILSTVQNGVCTIGSVKLQYDYPGLIQHIRVRTG